MSLRVIKDVKTHYTNIKLPPLILIVNAHSFVSLCGPTDAKNMKIIHIIVSSFKTVIQVRFRRDSNSPIVSGKKTAD